MSPRSLALVLLVLSTVPGCFGPAFSPPPTTIGDQGRTEWHVADGLCSGGLFGGSCDLSVPLAVGASATVVVRGRDGGPLAEGTHFVGEGVNISLTSTSDQDTYLSIGATRAGTVDVRVLDRDEHEIDRVHFTFRTATAIVCGELDTAAPRDYELVGLMEGAASITGMPPTAGSAPSADTAFACRATDADGNALLTVDAVRWSVAPGAVGTINLRSDTLFASETRGATIHVLTTGTGSATVHAQLGDASADVPVTFR